MKRKLNDNDVPEEVAERSSPSNRPPGFDKLGLEDHRLLQGIIRQEFSTPTAVQAKAIPLALQGKDILARSKTGSGKTAAYLLPILQAILKRKAGAKHAPHVEALILVPTRELASQVNTAVESFGAFCSSDVRAVNLTGRGDGRVQRAQLAVAPDIVIATPGATVTNLQNGSLSLDQLAHLVIDEADLVLSYNYGEDLETIAKSVPKGVQTFLVSATLGEDVDTLRGLFCQDPVTLSMDEEERNEAAGGTGGVTQYVVKCAEDEKFLLLYAIYKLKLAKGKSIIFVADVDRCYTVKLLLEQFGIKSCVLNSTLPVESRLHAIKEFNQNVYDIIIASDEHEVVGEEEQGKKKVLGRVEDESAEQMNGHEASETGDQNGEHAKDAAEQAEATKVPTASAPPKKKRKHMARDKNYGISRGLDFKAVAMILNFDLPRTPKSYTHRIGRTARAGQSGTALSFVVPASLYRRHKPTSHPSCADDETVLARISASQARRGAELQPYQFDMKALAGFRYRLESALTAVTPRAVLAARRRELAHALLASAKLGRHFEENPAEERALRHDTELRTARVQPHLRRVPEYLVPGGGSSASAPVERGGGLVASGLAKEKRVRDRWGKHRGQSGGKGKGTGARKADPLKTFNSKSRKK